MGLQSDDALLINNVRQLQHAGKILSLHNGETLPCQGIHVLMLTLDCQQFLAQSHSVNLTANRVILAAHSLRQPIILPKISLCLPHIEQLDF